MFGIPGMQSNAPWHSKYIRMGKRKIIRLALSYPYNVQGCYHGHTSLCLVNCISWLYLYTFLKCNTCCGNGCTLCVSVVLYRISPYMLEQLIIHLLHIYRIVLAEHESYYA